jgi:hypothetical protein
MIIPRRCVAAGVRICQPDWRKTIIYQCIMPVDPSDNNCARCDLPGDGKWPKRREAKCRGRRALVMIGRRNSSVPIGIFAF